jgi:Protein of unknown function (DUF2510)
VSDATTNTPPGWYPDATTPGGQRWWDGTQWTEHAQAPGAAYQPFAELKAPAGTNTNTVWIWLVALLPLLSLTSLFTIDIAGYMRQVLANPTSTSGMLSLYTSPGYLLSLALGLVTTVGTIVFAYIDWRTLKARGVPSPFHWAFIFLIFVSGGIVYPIGRSVVARRRAGGSLAPMWVAIAVYVIVIVAAIAWSVVITSQIFSLIPSYVPVS